MDSTNSSCGVNRASRLNKTLYSLPVHCLNEQDLQHENARGIMAHFHAPENEHNRFLASLTQQERAILRHIERPSPYNSKSAKPGWDGDVRPATATSPHATPGALTSSMKRSVSSATSSSMQARPASAGHPRSSTANITQKGVPCYGMSMIMDVDLLTGQPASAPIRSTQPWRVARVKSHAVQHSSYGHGAGGKRAKHQTYDFYKYNGFAGQGAKTSGARPASRQQQQQAALAARG